MQLKVKEIKLSRGLTLKLGDTFEFVRIDCGLTADLISETDPTPQDIQDALLDLGSQISHRLELEMVELGLISE